MVSFWRASLLVAAVIIVVNRRGGYVVKTYAGSELVPAVEAVLAGGQFLSSGLEGTGSTPE